MDTTQNTNGKKTEAILLGLTILPKRGGYKPDKNELLEPLKNPKIFIVLFCTNCNRYYSLNRDKAELHAEMAKKDLPLTKERGQWFFEQDGCICCNYHEGEGWRKVRLRKIEDIT